MSRLGNKYKKMRRTVLDIIGAFDGVFAYKGPRCVQIDLTNTCNNNCIGCWCNSPLLEDRKQTSDATLPTDMVLSLLNELKSMGTEEIYFAGGGEPFMHSEAMRIISYAKNKGFIVSINTNFTLVTEDIARYLVESKIDHLIVSLWAGTPDVYAETHPNKTEETFYEIKSCLQFLNRYKGGRGNAPCIKVYNVVFNMNYQNFQPMVDFIVATGSEAVEFTLIDTIPGKTDKLLLSERQAEELLFMAKKLKEQFDNEKNDMWLENYEIFLRRLSSACQENGEYDRDVMHAIPCYAGWTFARIIANGDVNSCLKSHRIPIGNLHKETFRSLWNSARQQEFRKKTRRFDIHDPYFRFIGNDTNAAVGCFRSCDNIGHSLLLHNKITRLNKPVKAILKTVAAVGRRRNSLCARN